MSRFVLLSVMVVVVAFVTIGITSPRCGLDVVFVLDRSQSVTAEQFEITKAFVDKLARDMVAKFRSEVSASGMQFALVPYNTFGNVELYLNQASDAAQLRTAIHNLQYFPGLTNTHDALMKVFHDVLVTEHGDRASSPNLVILLTDGRYTYGSRNPAIMAQRLRDEKKAQVVAIGVKGLNGPDVGVFYEELLSLTGRPDLVFNATSYEGLFDVADELLRSINCTTLV